jgi:hypothetical protein
MSVIPEARRKTGGWEVTMNKPILEVADVFRIGFADYNSAFGPLQPDHYKAADAIMACRTSLLGGHIDRCDHCNHERISYNSCRNRHCPKCQALLRTQWVEHRISDLLPVHYFHVVFTIPEHLNPFALRNKKAFYTIFFQAVSETLQAFANDEKYLGGEMAFFAVLHTWGQNLMDHPHIHCVIPGGALMENGKWKHCPKNFLFPIKPLSALFKGKLLDYFKKAIETGDIELCGNLQQYKNRPVLQTLLDTLYKTQWIVYVKPPFAGPKAVVKYLGRYTHRIAISNGRLVSMDDKGVAFKWKDYSDDNRQKIMPLTIVEFIRRFMLHVIPTGFVRIRHYGFLSNRSRKIKLNECRKALGITTSEHENNNENQSQHWYDLVIQLTGIDPTICPICKMGHMKMHKEIPATSPPLMAAKAAA